MTSCAKPSAPQESKRCRYCAETAPATEFYNNHGYLSPGCKTCTKAKAKKWAEEHKERRVEISRKSYDKAKKEGKTTKPPTRESLKKYRTGNPHKHAAHEAVARAIASGRLKKPDTCEKCGVKCVPHGHHDDYEKQLDVQWVCRPCHGQIHRAINDAKRGKK